MPLRWIEVENYRAIARGRVTFADTTVLFGENDSGRTSIIEALLLSLGTAGGRQDELTPVHFHHGDDGRPGPLHIRLGIEESARGEWSLPDRLEDVIRSDETRQLIFDFRADLDIDVGTGTLTHTVREPVSSRQIDGGPDTREIGYTVYSQFFGFNPDSSRGSPSPTVMSGSDKATLWTIRC